MEIGPTKTEVLMQNIISMELKLQKGAAGAISYLYINRNKIQITATKKGPANADPSLCIFMILL
jgi:hypothetical protein